MWKTLMVSVVWMSALTNCLMFGALATSSQEIVKIEDGVRSRRLGEIVEYCCVVLFGMIRPFRQGGCSDESCKLPVNDAGCTVMVFIFEIPPYVPLVPRR
jgi:hypothetical protein